MIISFDLDDTLIPSTRTFSVEKQNWILKVMRSEKIRKGTIQLFTELKNDGHQIYIYTTSFRERWKVLLMFRLYGIPVDRFINQDHHTKEARMHGHTCSKYPPAFGIDVHVDDSDGVSIEGERHNFRTIIIKDTDPDWTLTVRAALAKLS